jgi:hypothetical protein
VVLTTTRNQRLLSYAGSIPHWLYATGLRHHKRAWTTLMWWLSLVATVGAALGVIIGFLRLGKARPFKGDATSPSDHRRPRRHPHHEAAQLIVQKIDADRAANGFDRDLLKGFIKNCADQKVGKFRSTRNRGSADAPARS